MSSSGLRARRAPPRGGTPRAIRCPPSASPRPARPAVRGGSGRRRRRERVEQRRLEVFALEVPGRAWASLLTDSRCRKSGRNGSSDASSARILATTASAFAERRPEIERRAQNLHEDAVGHAVAVRAAAGVQHPQTRRRSEALLQLVAAAGSCRRPARRPPRSRLRRPLSARGRRAPAASTARPAGPRRASVPSGSTPPAASQSRSPR